MTSKSATHPFLTMAGRVFCRFGTLRYLPHCSDGTKRLIRGFAAHKKTRSRKDSFFVGPQVCLSLRSCWQRQHRLGGAHFPELARRRDPYRGSRTMSSDAAEIAHCWTGEAFQEEKSFKQVDSLSILMRRLGGGQCPLDTAADSEPSCGRSADTNLVLRLLSKNTIVAVAGNWQLT